MEYLGHRTSRFVALLLLFAVVPASATTFVAMSERTLARAADAVVVGTVEHLESVGTLDGGISTLVTIHVETAYKGSPGATLTLKQPGGELETRGFWLAGSPGFRIGQRNLLFLSAHRDGTARTTALGMGQFVLDTDRATGEVMAERTVTELVLGARRVRRMKLSRLVRVIERAVAADAGRAVAPLVDVPDEATAPDAERMTLEKFTLMDAPHGRWHQPDAGETITYGIDPEGDATLGVTASQAAVDGAMAAWTNVSGATITLERGGDVDAAPLLCDGVSQIVFNDPFGEMPNPVSCGGILALGGYCTQGRGGETDDVGGIRFRRITEGNITFNNGFGGCSFWNVENLAEVVTHEIGHTIGIGHSSEDDGETSPVLKDATMFYRAHFDGRGATLRPDDIAAVRAIYPGEGGSDPSKDDLDGDGVVDADDNCPGNDPTLGMANRSQTDTDDDGLGDLCDPCPLIPVDLGDQSCRQIALSAFQTTETRRGTRLDWRGAIDLTDGAAPATARVVLTGAAGTIFDTATATRTARQAHGLPARLTYRSGEAIIALRRGRFGTYRVRVRVRGATLDADGMPVISANLQVGGDAFTASLSCTPKRGRKMRCRG